MIEIVSKGQSKGQRFSGYVGQFWLLFLLLFLLLNVVG